MSEALRAFIPAWIEWDMNSSVLVAWINPQNDRSRRVLEKCGFVSQNGDMRSERQGRDGAEMVDGRRKLSEDQEQALRSLLQEMGLQERKPAEIEEEEKRQRTRRNISYVFHRKTRYPATEYTARSSTNADCTAYTGVLGASTTLKEMETAQIPAY
ncbi:hypothetical protein K402DRAFT_157864 [Aulographum hederae CBS 113979]|uniref:N-acetyltransferase domain-containing protein n=1 Tax=Aulographum hederae CBS 113979 TaxID=1176131 RepID=A0A6G1GSZ3_9PEZI|nr:hypothetical protein K402DRAFT_157864 [Aulographum hederae CBS 113979]